MLKGRVIAEAIGENRSRNYIEKLRRELEVGGDIGFNNNGHVITSYERLGKLDHYPINFGMGQEHRVGNIAKVNVSSINQLLQYYIITISVQYPFSFLLFASFRMNNRIDVFMYHTFHSQSLPINTC